jgi:FkbM family methyltransferase
MKNLIKLAARTIGFDIKRYIPSSSPGLQVAKALSQSQADIVLDVGANKGQYGALLREYGYKGKIVSFEPLQDAHRHLTTRSKHDASWLANDRCAVGDTESTVTINVAANSVSSSLLPMLPSHSAAASHSKYVSKELTPLHTLDKLCNKLITHHSKVFLKIDTQGYEMEVLRGAKNTMRNVVGLQCELSLTTLYRGQALWRDVVDHLTEHGLDIWAVLPGFTDPRTGQTLQVDGIFLRREYRPD